jgi:hypothetical protein
MTAPKIGIPYSALVTSERFVQQCLANKIKVMRGFQRARFRQRMIILEVISSSKIVIASHLLFALFFAIRNNIFCFIRFFTLRTPPSGPIFIRTDATDADETTRLHIVRGFLTADVRTVITGTVSVFTIFVQYVPTLQCLKTTFPSMY